MTLRFIEKDIAAPFCVGWYLEGHFYVSYYSSKMKIRVKREITNYADEEMKIYFKTLDLLDDSMWALNYTLMYKNGYFVLDIESIH